MLISSYLILLNITSRVSKNEEPVAAKVSVRDFREKSEQRELPAPAELHLSSLKSECRAK